MNSNNISIVGHDNCTGCGGCYNSCPKNAISMKYNAEGFLEPVVDEVACISCKKCIAICPVCNPVFRNNTRPDCYAAMAHDDIRQKSSSGGIFTVLAEYIFNKQGVVCGAAYNDDFLVEHIIIDKVEDLDKLRGSKYLQSDSKKVYSEIKKILDTGRDALFCGCPCQVAALNTFLGKEYSNLLTIDLMCHGGPAPLLFKKYLQEKYAGKELERFSFRDKSVFGWSTEANAYFKDGTSEHIKRTQDDYYRAFLPCLSVRKSCGSCKFSTLPRQGDVTLADFWGVRKYKESFDDHKGTSIVIINNEKASKIYRKIAENLKLNESVDFDYIMTLGQPFDKPFKNHPERDRFFEIVKGNSIAKAFNYIKNRKFDVGIIGVWPGLNYGSALTYYGLQKAVKNMGLSPLMIDKPGASNGDPEIAMSHSRRFAKDHFNISKSYPLKELHTLNRHCDSFVIGSDQVWNYGISKNFGKSFYLDFVNDDKKKIAYAVSFGHGT
ncbi:MAG: Coenzyme F420 hydrogenase/dehydrogenase, beta subunit C-terminal domain, partial [Prevotella sp.]|nr:Coenzyme F420 hydrogenase/dehydrogenase, beta subunit C-terminal domain [Prevotella sp.]